MSILVESLKSLPETFKTLLGKDKKLRIGVMLPSGYSVAEGMARTCIDLCDRILRLHSTCEVVLGTKIPAKDLASLADSIRSDRFRIYDLHWSQAMDDEGRPWVRPFSLTGYDYMDCDAWILFTYPHEGIVAPLKPYAMFCADLLCRIIPGSVEFTCDMDHSSWTNLVDAFRSYRNSALTFTTTERTAQDVIGYAGVPSDRVVVAPLFIEFGTRHGAAASAGLPFDEYILWTTNISAHKNHKRAFEALEQYFLRYPTESLPVIVSGVRSDLFDPISGADEAGYPSKFHSFLKARPQMMAKIYFAGALPRDRFEAALRGATFVWHNVIYDNGTASCFEAAQLGVPCLSSDYPQMRYFNQQFGTNARFFSAFDVEQMVQSLIDMTRAVRRGHVATFSKTAMSTEHANFDRWLKSAIKTLLQGTPQPRPLHPAGRSLHSPEDLSTLRLGLARTGLTIWKSAALYVRDFPFEDVPILTLIIGEASADAARTALLAMETLLRERYQNFKVLIFASSGDHVVAPIRAFLHDKVLGFDFLYAGSPDDRPMVGLACRISMATYSIGDFSHPSDINSQVEASGSAAFDLTQLITDSLQNSATGTHITVSTIDDVIYDTWMKSSAGFSHAAKYSTHRAALRNDFPIPALPQMPQRLDFREESGDFWLVSGFEPLNDGYRWVRQTASLWLRRATGPFSIVAICEDYASDAGSDELTMAVYIDDLRQTDIKMRPGVHEYVISTPSVAPGVGRCAVRIECSFSYKAGGPASSDKRMLSWGAIAIGFLGEQIEFR